jgi:N utilization substance protein A
MDQAEAIMTLAEEKAEEAEQAAANERRRQKELEATQPPDGADAETTLAQTAQANQQVAEADQVSPETDQASAEAGQLSAEADQNEADANREAITQAEGTQPDESAPPTRTDDEPAPEITAADSPTLPASDSPDDVVAETTPQHPGGSSNGEPTSAEMEPSQREAGDTASP